ncbi:MAG TPA: rRNA maturation RNase YbeY, partial [Cytophagaceae bacterium]|nr:rRNA maturation RNase YbeY [Cytophagaceae bacterium]
FILPQKTLIRQWLHKVAKKEGYKIDHLNYIFCNDQYLLEINKNYLNHNTLTDIITFGLSDKNKSIEGDIYISIERVSENARIFGQIKSMELKRVMAHGLLHLMGYKDKSKKDVLTMRKEEDTCLNLWLKISK